MAFSSSSRTRWSQCLAYFCKSDPLSIGVLYVCLSKRKLGHSTPRVTNCPSLLRTRLISEPEVSCSRELLSSLNHYIFSGHLFFFFFLALVNIDTIHLISLIGSRKVMSLKPRWSVYLCSPGLDWVYRVDFLGLCPCLQQGGKQKLLNRGTEWTHSKRNRVKGREKASIWENKRAGAGGRTKNVLWVPESTLLPGISRWEL